MSRAWANRAGSSIVLLKVKATMTPTPGAVISRRQMEHPRASRMTARCSTASSRRRASRAARRGVVISSSIAPQASADACPFGVGAGAGCAGWPAASARIRPAKPALPMCRTFRPKFRSRPRRRLSRSRTLSTGSLRAVNRARPSWASRALAGTGLNQPRRSSCAIPRASLRSVLTAMIGTADHPSREGASRRGGLRGAESAALTCRVSSSVTARPALLSSACSHRARRARSVAAGAAGSRRPRVGQRPGLEANPLGNALCRSQPEQDGFRLAGHLALAHDPTRAVDQA